MANIKYHGAIIFRNLGNGILNGKYVNPDNKMPFPETARLIKKTGGDLFEGIYESIYVGKVRREIILHEKRGLKEERFFPVKLIQRGVNIT